MCKRNQHISALRIKQIWLQLCGQSEGRKEERNTAARWGHCHYFFPDLLLFYSEGLSSIKRRLLTTICAPQQRIATGELTFCRQRHVNGDGVFSYLKRFPLDSALLRTGEFAVDTPRAATPVLTANPCGVQLCKRIKAGNLKLAPQQAGRTYYIVNHQSIQHICDVIFFFTLDWCKRSLSLSTKRWPVWEKKQPQKKATHDTSGQDGGLRLSGESLQLRSTLLLPSYISQLQSRRLWWHFAEED